MAFVVAPPGTGGSQVDCGCILRRAAAGLWWNVNVTIAPGIGDGH